MHLKCNSIYIMYEKLQWTIKKKSFADWRKMWEHVEYKLLIWMLHQKKKNNLIAQKGYNRSA